MTQAETAPGLKREGSERETLPSSEGNLVLTTARQSCFLGAYAFFLNFSFIEV